MATPLRLIAALSLFLAAACGSDGGSGGGDSDGGGDGDDGGAGGGIDADLSGCQPPDMLVLLDRTMSMHRMPNGTPPPNTLEGRMSSKWWAAVDSIESFTSSIVGVRFGLALFPQDPGGEICVTLEERIDGNTAGNPVCEAGEIAVTPALNSAADIAAAIDQETTRLCNTTPIGAGFATAITELAAIQDPIRDQYVVLLTDGQDTCDEPLVLTNVHALAQSGVGVFAIGFDASGNGVDNGLLNDVACAGRTAPEFPTPCTDDGSGNFTATDRDGAPLYLLAENASELTAAFEEVAGGVCCGCVE